MSETVHYTGKLTRVPQFEGNTEEDKAQSLLGKKGITVRDDWNGTWVEQLMEDAGNEYVTHNGAIYSVERKEKDSD